MNLYQYVGNNPASYTDPFGLSPCLVPPVAPWCVGAALGAAAIASGFLASHADEVGSAVGGLLDAGSEAVGNVVFATKQKIYSSRAGTSLDIAQQHLQGVGGLPPGDPKGKKPDWLKHARKHLNNAQKYIDKVKGKTAEELQQRLDSLEDVLSQYK